MANLLTCCGPFWYVQNMNVHKSNDKRQDDQDTYKSLLLLDEISKGMPLSQRDMSRKLNLALGLVNSYLKNLVAKGYVTVKAIPARRYAYYLTPKGFAEKTRLSYQLLKDYTRIYRETRGNLKRLFEEMKESNVKKLVFAGADEIAEIAYITLQETDLQLTGIVDGELAGRKFFGFVIKPLSEIANLKFDCVVITSYLMREKIHDELLKNGVKDKDIRLIYTL